MTIALSVAVGIAVSLFNAALGSETTRLLYLLIVGVVMCEPSTRGRLARVLGYRARRRRLGQALLGVAPSLAAPRLLSYREDPTGSWAEVRTGPGGTITELEDQAESLAAWIGAYEVRFQRHPSTAGQAVLRALRQDPLQAELDPWPWLAKASTDLWGPVPVGVDEMGRRVGLSLAGHNLLIGGEPGSGKSVALAQVVAAAALDPAAKLWLMDGKVVELAAWSNAAEGSAGVDIGYATELLVEVQAEMERRYQELLDFGLRKVRRGTGLHLVVVDELAHYCTWPDRKPRERFCDLLRDLVSRGRAAGVVVVAATQKPGSDIVPTSLRDLFGYRWALRCTTPAASDTVLGSGWASQGISGHTVAAHQRGVGWLHHEASRPVRLRAYHLSDDDVSVLAARAEQLRETRS